MRHFTKLGAAAGGAAACGTMTPATLAAELAPGTVIDKSNVDKPEIAQFIYKD